MTTTNCNNSNSNESADDSVAIRPPSYLTRQDESCLKTALAFVILARKHKKKKRQRISYLDNNDDYYYDEEYSRDEAEDDETSLAKRSKTMTLCFCRNLFDSNIGVSSDCNVSSSLSQHHLNALLEMAMTSVQHHRGEKMMVVYPVLFSSSQYASSMQHLEGIMMHIVRQFKQQQRHFNPATKRGNYDAGGDWIATFIQQSLESQQQQMVADTTGYNHYKLAFLCAFWHACLEYDPETMTLPLLTVVGNLLRPFFSTVSNHHDEVLLVNLVFLLEATLHHAKQQEKSAASFDLFQQFMQSAGIYQHPPSFQTLASQRHGLLHLTLYNLLLQFTAGATT